MVERVRGRIDQTDIIFTHIEGDLWQAQVPFHSDGTYAVELFAVDYAGNEAYLCKMLFVLDGLMVKAYLIESEYVGTPVEMEHLTEVDLAEFLADALKRDYLAEKGG